MQDLRATQSGPVGVLGLWHLGSVTAACLAEAGYDVVGVDPDGAVVQALRDGRPPVSEPGLSELMGGAGERLRFSSEGAALADVSRVWVTFDTPVDEEDNADVDHVMGQCEQLLAPLPTGALVIVSSQLPVGSVARLRALCAARRGEDTLRFACVPENLRLGAALESFRSPDRIVVGAGEEDREELAALLAPFCTEIQWMRVESAEMTKHALNSFLATSVSFINEVAVICESVGADAAEVSRGLKSERRIGPGAYLAPGEAFAGGTLARDVGFLRALAERHARPAEVLSGVAAGNAAHKHWPRRKLLELLGGESALAEATVAVWGLTYKPGTDTLRRSSAVELCRWLVERGAAIRAHDPLVTELPPDLAAEVELCGTPLAAATGAHALVLCTAWPVYREVAAQELTSAMRQPVVIDAAGFAAGSLGGRAGLQYVRVGSPGPLDEPHGQPVASGEASR